MAWEKHSVAPYNCQPKRKFPIFPLISTGWNTIWHMANTEQLVVIIVITQSS